jgi:hypothetical protein
MYEGGAVIQLRGCSYPIEGGAVSKWAVYVSIAQILDVHKPLERLGRQGRGVPFAGKWDSLKKSQDPNSAASGEGDRH